MGIEVQIPEANSTSVNTVDVFKIDIFNVTERLVVQPLEPEMLIGETEIVKSPEPTVMKKCMSPCPVEVKPIEKNCVRMNLLSESVEDEIKVVAMRPLRAGASRRAGVIGRARDSNHIIAARGKSFMKPDLESAKGRKKFGKFMYKRTDYCNGKCGKTRRSLYVDG